MCACVCVCVCLPGMCTMRQLQFSTRYRVSQSMRQAVILNVLKKSESMGVALQSPHGGGRYTSYKTRNCSHILLNLLHEFIKHRIIKNTLQNSSTQIFLLTCTGVYRRLKSQWLPTEFDIKRLVHPKIKISL